MNAVQILIFILPVKASVGGHVHVPPTLCLPSAYSAAHAAAYVEYTGSTRTNGLASMQPARELAQNSFISEVD